METTSKKMPADNTLFHVLDVTLGHVPKPLLYVISILGAGTNILGAVDIGLRIVIGIVTLLVLWYTIKSHRASIAANQERQRLDAISYEIKKAELEKIQAGE